MLLQTGACNGLWELQLWSCGAASCSRRVWALIRGCCRVSITSWGLPPAGGKAQSWPQPPGAPGMLLQCPRADVGWGSSRLLTIPLCSHTVASAILHGLQLSSCIPALLQLLGEASASHPVAAVPLVTPLLCHALCLPSECLHLFHTRFEPGWLSCQHFCDWSCRLAVACPR